MSPFALSDLDSWKPCVCYRYLCYRHHRVSWWARVFRQSYLGVPDIVILKIALTSTHCDSLCWLRFQASRSACILKQEVFDFFSAVVGLAFWPRWPTSFHLFHIERGSALPSYFLKKTNGRNCWGWTYNALKICLSMNKSMLLIIRKASDIYPSLLFLLILEAIDFAERQPSLREKDLLVSEELPLTWEIFNPTYIKPPVRQHRL